jgi:hypothetical protein
MAPECGERADVGRVVVRGGAIPLWRKGGLASMPGRQGAPLARSTVPGEAVGGSLRP